jgi:predicted 2-oxoglutarate/Fe(II)-dependent dioxygenase YbiX
MIDFSINNFFTKDECDVILNFALENGIQFSYLESEKNSWDCKRIYDEKFKSDILEKFKNLFTSKKLNLWFNLDEFDIRDINVSLTRYYDGRFLELHKDTTSQLTTVILLSENFDGGNFIISKDMVKIEDYKIEIGHGITFDGSKTFHGVLPVTNGIRCALNIWMTNTDFKYNNHKQNRSLL